MRYKTEDGTTVDTDKASAHWEESTYWDGKNHISKATGSQWEHETLYRSSKGRYYIKHTSDWQGSLPYAYFISDEEAAGWLLNNDEELPDDLKAFEAEASE